MHKNIAAIGLTLLLSALTVAGTVTEARGRKEVKESHSRLRGIARVKVLASKDMGLRTWDMGKNDIRSPEPKVLGPMSKAQSPAPLLSVVAQPDIRPDDQIFLDRVLRALPTICTANLEEVVVRYPSTSLRASDIERGQATATTMILRGPLSSLPEKERAEMIAVVVHELCGHGVDLGVLRGTPESGESAFPDGPIDIYNNDPSTIFYAISWESSEARRKDAKKEDFVSGYALENPFEDAAESVIYFELQEQAFRTRAAENPVLAAKLAWVETYVFPERRGLALGTPWNGKIPWDATKVAYESVF